MKCRHCGKEFEPKQHGRKNTGFCCKHCADNYRRIEKIKKDPNVTAKTCTVCGKEFYTLCKGKKCCSKECLATLKLLDVRPAKPCAICGQLFSTKTSHDRYCSKECKKQAEKKREQRRRIERRHATNDQKNRKINMQKLYDDSKGICGICGLPVPQDCDEIDEWSITRDHIVPVTKGGAHTYSNCQLAHRLCNSLKGREGDDFKISWLKMFRSDRMRWGEKLLRLGLLLNAEENEIAAAKFLEPPGGIKISVPCQNEDRRALPRGQARIDKGGVPTDFLQNENQIKRASARTQKTA